MSKLPVTPKFWLTSYLVLCGVLSPPNVFAEEVIFTLDQSQSTDTWSGTDSVYGPFQPQTAGSLSPHVAGHFVVDFDATNHNPNSIQFLGKNSNGYFQLTNSTAHATPGGGAANIAGTTAGGEFQWASRNTTWDFYSGVINGANGVFTAATTSFDVISLNTTFVYTGQSPGGGDSPSPGHVLSSGTWTLTETPASSGNWTLVGDGVYNYGYAATGALLTASSLTATGHIVATAHFGAGNVAVVPQSPSDPIDVLNSSSTTGGVTLTFSPNASGGSISAQQLPGLTSLAASARSAADQNSQFLLSTSDGAIGAPQIWNIDYSGSLNGGTATVIFNYDPALLPQGMDQSKLGMWHFNSLSGQWEFGGTVNPLNHTIAFVTSSFSPFELGVQAVPEPSSFALAALGVVMLLARRRSVKHINYCATQRSIGRLYLVLKSWAH
jgi:hypothetical protein